MGDRRYNLSERDRLLIATACRYQAKVWRADVRNAGEHMQPATQAEIMEKAAQLEHLADTMATSA